MTMAYIPLKKRWKVELKHMKKLKTELIFKYEETLWEFFTHRNLQPSSLSALETF